MSEVVRLRDNSTVSHPGKPHTDTIKMLEEYLKRAKDGEVVGAAIVVVYYDEMTNAERTGLINRGQVGRMFSLMQRMTHELDGA